MTRAVDEEGAKKRFDGRECERPQMHDLVIRGEDDGGEALMNVLSELIQDAGVAPTRRRHRGWGRKVTRGGGEPDSASKRARQGAFSPALRDGLAALSSTCTACRMTTRNGFRASSTPANAPAAGRCSTTKPPVDPGKTLASSVRMGGWEDGWSMAPSALTPSPPAFADSPLALWSSTSLPPPLLPSPGSISVGFVAERSLLAAARFRRTFALNPASLDLLSRST